MVFFYASSSSRTGQVLHRIKVQCKMMKSRFLQCRKAGQCWDVITSYGHYFTDAHVSHNCP